MTGPFHVSFSVVEGVVRLLQIPRQFWDMFVHLQNFETTTTKFSESWIVSKLTLDPAGDRSVRNKDGSS